MFEQKDLKALHMILFCNGGQWPRDEFFYLITFG